MAVYTPVHAHAIKVKWNVCRSIIFRTNNIHKTQNSDVSLNEQLILSSVCLLVWCLEVNTYAYHLAHQTTFKRLWKQIFKNILYIAARLLFPLRRAQNGRGRMYRSGTFHKSTFFFSRDAVQNSHMQILHVSVKPPKTENWHWKLLL